MNDLERKFYEEIKHNIKELIKRAKERIKGIKEIKDNEIKSDYEYLKSLKLTDETINSTGNIMEDQMTTLIHSLFVSIDGGTAISDHGKAIELIDFKTGQPLTKGALYENFIEYYYSDDEKDKK